MMMLCSEEWSACPVSCDGAIRTHTRVKKCAQRTSQFPHNFLTIPHNVTVGVTVDFEMSDAKARELGVTRALGNKREMVDCLVLLGEEVV